jgi:HJR/Mrr/RecB family endonuclease
MKAIIGLALAVSILASVPAKAQDAPAAGAPPTGAYFPASPSPSPGDSSQGTAPAPAQNAASSASFLPQWLQTSGSSDAGSQTCGMHADLGNSWSMSLAADAAQPTMFTLTLNGAYQFPADGPQRIQLYYDRGFQVLSGTASGTGIAIPLDATNFARFLHGFTASRSMLITDGGNTPFNMNLDGTSAAISALGQCTLAAGFTQLPAPWHAAQSEPSADNASSQATGSEGSISASTGAAAAASVAPDQDTPSASSQSGATASNPDAAPPTSGDSGDSDGSNMPLILGAIAIFVIALVIWKAIAASRAKDQALSIAKKEIAIQAQRLGIRRQQLLVPDHYGTVDGSKWQREMNVFIQTRIITLLANEGLQSQFGKISTDVYSYLDYMARTSDVSPTIQMPVSDPRVFSSSMRPEDYEMHCALLLRSAGWDANRVGMSGDQGTDVLARAGDLVLVVQCKLYSSSIGNDAVQQVMAARTFQQAQLAAVVSNQPFTPSARALAATGLVLLLHHSELPNFPPSKFATTSTVNVIR